MNKKPSISTGTGDSGETGLYCGGRTSKTDPQIVATGDCDELSAVLGLAKALVKEGDTTLKETLEAIQMDLITVMGDISLNRYVEENKDFTIALERITWIEGIGVHIENSLPPIKGWILSGTNQLSASLHIARTVCRRAERSMLNVPEGHRAAKPSLKYINRLSDLLYLLARDSE